MSPPGRRRKASANAASLVERLRPGVRAGLPFALAVFLVGISFGVVAREVMGVVAPIVMSAVVFAGAAQFGATAVLESGGAVASAIVAAILLNARYGPMGMALAPSLSGGALKRAAQGQAMVDASWAMASRGGGRFDRDFMIGATLPQYPAWIAGTALGVVFGELIGDPDRFGIDAVFPAFFLALLVTEARRGTAEATTAALGAAVALTVAPLTPPGVPVIAACGVALIGLVWR